MSGHARRRTASLACLVAGVGLLFAGRFVQFDDFSGFGSERWIFPFGILALILAVAAVVIAWADPRTRLWLGIALAILLALLVWQHAVNDGFRFIWTSDEGELAQLEVVVALVAVVLMTTAGAALGGGRWLVRAAAYLCGSVALVFVAFLAGLTYYDATVCKGNDGDCLAPLGGMVWGLVAIPVCLVAIVVIELVLWRRTKRR